MNLYLKTSSDNNIVQQQAARTGLKAAPGVSFDMFKFNALIKDFKSEQVRPKPEPVPQGVHHKPFENGQDEIQTKQDSFKTTSAVRSGDSDNKNEQVCRDRDSSAITDHGDKKDSIQDTSNIQEAKDRSSGLRTSDMEKGDQSFSTFKDSLQTDYAGTNENQGQHIGAFLSNIIESGEAGLLIDNLINQGNASAVSEIAKAGNKTVEGNDVENGNLLSHLIRGHINRGDISGQVSGQTGENEVSADEIISRMNPMQTGKSEIALDQKTPDANSGKLFVSESGSHLHQLDDALPDTPGDDNEYNLMEKLAHSRVKDPSLEGGTPRETAGDVSSQSGKYANEPDKNIIESDKKMHNSDNHIKHHLNHFENIAESGVKEVSVNENGITDKPIAGIAEHIQVATAAKVSADPKGRSESSRSESSSNGTLSNPNSSHESTKAGEGLKSISTARPSAFNEIIDKITYVVKGNTKLDVKIESESLGRLNINVSIEKGLVNVHINSADKAVREFVESNMQQIVDSLSKNGVSVGGFSVGLRNNRSHGDNQNPNKSADGNDSSAGRTKEKAYITSASRMNHGDRRVNIFA